jgi:PAS domain S-box-containing protein
MKNRKRASHGPRRISPNGAVSKDGATKRLASAPVFRSPKTKLEAAIQRYADLFDFAPIAYVSFDRVGRIEEINHSAAELLGRSRAKLIGQPFALHVTKQDRGLFLNHLFRCRSSDRRVETELHLNSRSGESLVVHLASSPMTSSMRDGALLYQTAILDLTEEKLIEERLAEQARLLDLSNDAILVRDPRDRIIFWNRGAIETYGYTADEALGEVSHKLLQTEHSEPLKRIREKLARDGRWSGELVHTCKHDRKVIVMSRWVLDRDAHGKQAHILETNTDITLRKQAEEKLRQAVEFDEAVLQNMAEGLYTVDMEGRATYMNPAAEKLLGWSFKELRGKNVHAITHHQNRDGTPFPAEKCAVLQVLKQGQALINHEDCFIRKDGSFFDVVCSSAPLKSGEGIIGSAVVFDDITDRKQAEEAAQRLQETSTQLIHGEDVDALYLEILDTAIALMHSDMGSLQMFYPERGELQLLASKGFAPKSAAFWEWVRPESGSACARALSTQQRVIATDVEKCDFMAGTKDLDAYRKSDIAAVQSTPLISRSGSVVGMISTHWRKPHQPAERELHLFDVLARQAADLIERKQAEEALQRSNQLLEKRVRERTRELHKINKILESEINRRKGLEGEILAISDREQQRLGQELHDGLCQHLTAVAFMSRSIAMRLKNHRVIEVSDIEKIAQLVNDAATDTRNLSRALHRVDVDAAGLIVALQDLADREIWRIPCRLEAKPSFRVDDDAAAAHLYRIAREAVINANKHAQAREIVVRLERVRREMVLRVIDDGIGLPKQLKPQQGLGFHIMNYRAQLLGGRMEIDSPATGGTRVSCYLPLDAAQSKKAPNADRLNVARPTNSAVPLTSEVTLRHLARRRAANA